MSELVVILKGGTKQKNVIGAVLADKASPPFADRHDGYRFRWWGVDHPVSQKIRILVNQGQKALSGDGLCPDRAWCFAKRLKVSKNAVPTFRCGFEQHHALRQCPESGNGHERIADRGIAGARCAGVAFCGEAECYHAKPHRWDASVGCHAMRCRKLTAIIESWDQKTRGQPPDDVVVCERVMKLEAMS